MTSKAFAFEESNKHRHGQTDGPETETQDDVIQYLSSESRKLHSHPKILRP